jgi:hypothetical protein
VENEGFNRQKDSGLNLEHVYSTDPEKWKACYLPLQLAFILVQLLERGSLVRRRAVEWGRPFAQLFGSLKNVARRLLESVRFLSGEEAWFDPTPADEIRVALDSSSASRPANFSGVRRSRQGRSAETATAAAPAVCPVRAGLRSWPETSWSFSYDNGCPVRYPGTCAATKGRSWRTHHLHTGRGSAGVSTARNGRGAASRRIMGPSIACWPCWTSASDGCSRAGSPSGAGTAAWSRWPTLRA